jgi:hypothetical protein
MTWALLKLLLNVIEAFSFPEIGWDEYNLQRETRLH